MNSKFVEPFLQALPNVFGTMIGIEIRPEKQATKINNLSLGAVSGLIAMTSDNASGSFSISLETSMALACVERLFGERPETVNDEVIDMVGELTNMIAGVAKQLFESRGYDFGMATPHMMSGDSHQLEHLAGNPVILIPFNSDFGKLFLEICIDY